MVQLHKSKRFKKYKVMEKETEFVQVALNRIASKSRGCGFRSHGFPSNFTSCPSYISLQERMECRLLEGRERLTRVRRSAASTAEHTAAGGCEAIDRQLGALSQALEQWEGAALRARDSLEGALAATAASEEEYDHLTTQLENDLKELDGWLRGWSQELIKAEGRSNGEEAVDGWQLAKV